MRNLCAARNENSSTFGCWGLGCGVRVVGCGVGRRRAGKKYKRSSGLHFVASTTQRERCTRVLVVLRVGRERLAEPSRRECGEGAAEMEGGAGGRGHWTVAKEADVRDEELDSASDIEIEKVRRTPRGFI